jgi:hypothetical protein
MDCEGSETLVSPHLDKESSNMEMQPGVDLITDANIVALVVEDVDPIREALTSLGIEVTDVQLLGRDLSPGPRLLLYKDREGNGWVVEEAKRS